jgi:hypothetical protein
VIGDQNGMGSVENACAGFDGVFGAAPARSQFVPPVDFFFLGKYSVLLCIIGLCYVIYL